MDKPSTKQNAKQNAKQNEKIAELVRKVKAGDNEAFETLYDCTWKSVHYIIARNIENETDSFVLLNEVYVEAYSCIQSLEYENAFMKWITRIAYIRCVEFLKVKYKLSIEEPMGDSVGVDLEEEDDELIPENALINQEAREVILRAIEKLPPAQRDTVFMFYYHNLTISEIADVTACPENAVYKRLHDAKKALKVRLSYLVTKGVSLYSMADFHILKEIFQKDIDDYAARVSQAASWAAIAGQIGVAAPVAAKGASAAATAATKAVGAAATNALVVKTVLVGAIAATIATTAAVTREKFFKPPGEMEQSVIIQDIGDSLDTPENSPYPSEEIALGASETATPEPHTPGIVGAAGVSPRPENGLEHRQITAASGTEVPGYATSEQPFQEGRAYETGRRETTSPQPEAAAALTMPSPRPEVSEEIQQTEEAPYTEETPSEETAAAVTAAPHEEQARTEAAHSEPIENTLPPTPKPTPRPTATATPTVVPTPRATSSPKTSQGSQGGGGGRDNGGNESGAVATPGNITKYFEHVYELNSAPKGDAVIGDIAIFSGEMFRPGVDAVTVLENDYDSEKAGAYTVRVNVARTNNGGTLELNATIYVADITPPVIEVVNPIVMLTEGVTVTAEEILQKAGASVTDNSGEVVVIEVVGLEEIDFETPGQYSLALNAKDSQGNEAVRRVVVINIVA